MGRSLALLGNGRLINSAGQSLHCDLGLIGPGPNSIQYAPPHQRAGRPSLQLFGRSGRDDATVIRVAVGFIHVMRREEDRDSLVAPEIAGLRIQSESGLVQEEDPRMMQKSARDLETSLRASRARRARRRNRSLVVGAWRSVTA